MSLSRTLNTIILRFGTWDKLTIFRSELFLLLDLLIDVAPVSETRDFEDCLFGMLPQAKSVNRSHADVT